MSMKQELKAISIDKELSRRMSVMSFICACMIVLIHCTPHPNNGSWQWWFINLLGGDGLCRIAVPWFFLASGFFLGGCLNEEGWYKKAVIKRVRSLLVPFVIWAIIGLVVSFSMWYGIQCFGYKSQMPNPFSAGVVNAILTSLGFNLNKINIGPIWYLRMLFILVLISPIIFKGIKKFKCWLPIILFIIYGIYDTVYHFNNFCEYVISIRGIAYFSIGLWLRNVNLNLFKRERVMWLSMFVGCAGIVINAYGRYIAMPIIENFCDFIMVVPLMYLVWRFTSLIKIPKWCVDNSFALYVMHITFLNISIVMISMLGFRASMESSVTIALVRFIVAIGFSLLTASIIKRFLPNLSRLLFGGR